MSKGVYIKRKIIHECNEEYDECCETHIAFNTYTNGETSSSWYMDDGEYYPSVRYCPYCGEKLEQPAVDTAIATEDD